MKKLLIALFLSLSVPAGVEATTWYVAKTGSDSNNCNQAQSSSTPKLTIGAALACIGTASGAGAGHVVEVAGGTYNEQLINNIPKGRSWSTPFTLRAKSGDTVTIRSTSANGFSNILFSTATFYSIVDGLILDGSGGIVNSQIRIEYASQIRLTSLEIKNTNAENGIFSVGSSSLELLNSKIHDGTFSTGSGGGFAHAVYCSGCDNFLIEGNEIYNIQGWGVHIYPTGDNITVARNRIHNYGLGVPNGSGTGILFHHGNGNMAYNNIIYNGRFGIDVGGTNTKIYNNTVYGQTWHGIRVGSPATGAVVKNNISYQNGLNGVENQGSGSSISNNLTADPKFVATASNDFYVQSTSAAIDAGATLSEVTTDFNGVPRPQGAAYDIGAYEYGSLVPISSSSPVSSSGVSVDSQTVQVPSAPSSLVVVP